MIGQSGGGDSPEQPMPAKSPSGAAVGGVVLRSSPSSAPAVTPPRPQSMFSPSPRPSPSPVADTVTLTIKQWTEINDKISNLECTVETQREQFSKSIKELTSKVHEVTETLLQMQMDLEKVTDLVTQV